MVKKIVTTSIAVAAFIAVSAQYDVRKFGAVGNGVALDTRSIQDAIDSASINNGGTVHFPAGVFKIGTVVLKSNVQLELSPGTVILGSDNINDYTLVHQQYESRTRDLYAKFFMFFAENETNISISGRGTINGNGLKHFQEERPQNVRPFMIRFTNCTQVLMRDVRLIESANWTVHMLACSNVNIEGISVITTAEGNRDGIDIDASRNVTIANCYVSTTDDAIVMKSTSDDICSDITLTNCVLSSKGSAIKTGTESNGGFKNITVTNCVIKDIPQHAGIELMTVDGGRMQNVLIGNITMENVATPFFIRIGARARPYKSGQYVQSVQNAGDISLQNINVLNAKLPSSIIGLENKRLMNISVTGYTARYVESQPGVAYNKVPSLEFEYPAANMFSNLPAFGIYCRDVSGLRLRDVKLYASSQENRPALVIDRADEIELQSVEVSNGRIPLAYLRNIEDAIIAFCRSDNESKTLFQIEGNISNRLVLTNNFLRKGQSLTANAKMLPAINIDRYDTKNVSGGQRLANGGITIPVTMKKGEAQLCLLVKNEKTGSAMLKITYDKIVQEFAVDWQRWGWVPISLLKQFSGGEHVDIKIEATDEEAALTVKEYFIRSVNNGYTD